MQPQRCNLAGLARLLAVCALAALMLAVSLLISLRVSAQPRTQGLSQEPVQHPVQHPVQPFYPPTAVVTEPGPVDRFHPIIIDLGVTCAGQSLANAVNAGGTVAGQCDFNGNRGTLWQNGAWANPHPLPGAYGNAYALNDAGQAAGSSVFSGTTWPGEAWHAVLWQGDVISDLGTLGGAASAALGINNHGAVVGNSVLADNLDYAAFLWANGVMTPLAASASTAFAINDLGQIVGNIATSDSTDGAVLWYMGVMTGLPTLGGQNSGAYAINNLGQIVGFSSSAAETQTHAVLWANGIITDLGDLGGGYSAAYGINELGQVVGDSTPPGSQLRAFFWENGRMRALPTLGGTAGENYCHAKAINDSGMVVGDCFGTSAPHAVLWDLWDNTSLYLPAIKRQAR